MSNKKHSKNKKKKSINLQPHKENIITTKTSEIPSWLVIMGSIIMVACIVIGVIFTTSCKEHVDSDNNSYCDKCNEYLTGNISDQDNKDPITEKDNVDDFNILPVGFEIGQRCPSLELPLLLEDSIVKIDDYRGRVVILNFWGSWCPPCKAELPDFDLIATNYSNEAVVLTIHSNYLAEEGQIYVKENFNNSKMIFAVDEFVENNLDKNYGLMGGDGRYPMTFVIDPDGIVYYSQYGMMDYSMAEIIIQHILNKN